MPPVPAPERPPGFPEAKRKRSKGRPRRWVDHDGAILEWDYLHGAVEKYDKQGHHLGEFDPETGELRKGPDAGRRIEP